MVVDKESDEKSDIQPHQMAVHACSKNEFTEDEKCHNLMTWLNWCYWRIPGQIQTLSPNDPLYIQCSNTPDIWAPGNMSPINLINQADNKMCLFVTPNDPADGLFDVYLHVLLP